MSETFEQLTFWPEVGTSTLLRAVSRASQPPLPGNDKALRIPDGSGPNTCDSSWISSLSGYLRRTCQVFYRSGNPTPCSLIWKRRVTKSGRSSWVLGRSVPRTNAIGCGLSAGSDWPTVTANESPTRTNCGGSNGRVGPERPMLAGAVLMWPTPRTLTGGPESAERKRALGRTESGGGDLQSAVQAANFPTPGARDYRSPNLKPYAERGGGTKGEQLPNFLRHWNTPTSQDCEQAGSAKRGGLTNDARCAGPHDQANLSTSGKLTDWWATPRVSVLEGHAVATDTHGWDLPAQTKHEQRMEAGQLNPDWVEQLQGLPDGWSRLPDATVSRLLATRTRRSSRT